MLNPALAWGRLTRVIGVLQQRGMEFSDPMHAHGHEVRAHGIAFRLQEPPPSEQHRRGVTETLRTHREDGALIGLEVTVTIQPGLPDFEFDRVAAHELMHVWLAHRDSRPPKQVEEGLAEALSYWYVGHVGHQLAPYLRHSIATQEDEIYGGGFRRVRRAEEFYDWADVVNNVLKTGQLPT